MNDILQEKNIQKLFTRYSVRFAYLFGSRATGEGKIAASDYDIAVFFGVGTPRSRFAMRLKLMEELQNILAPVRVDLLVLDDICSIALRYEIINTGRLIYKKDESRRIDFEFRAIHEYEDFAPFLHAYNQMYIKHTV